MSHRLRPARRSWRPSLAVAAILVAVAGLGLAALPPRGQVPDDIRARVVADLTARTGRDVSATSGYYRVTELRSQVVTWPDRRLGCDYEAAATRAEAVSGYWLVLQIGATTYDYRISGERIVLCEAPSLGD